MEAAVLCTCLATGLFKTFSMVEGSGLEEGLLAACSADFLSASFNLPDTIS
jgi:hypothetical protein